MATVDDMSLLEEKLARHEAYKPKIYDRKRTLLDAEFHIQLAAMTKNRVLQRQIKNNLEHFYIRFKFDNYDLKRLETSVAEHKELIKKIKKKDIMGGIEVIRAHIQNARDQIVRSLSSDENYEQLEAI